VVTNLLTNAAKYMEEEGAIVVSAQVAGDDLILSVRDTGIGIPAKMLPQVFDMFMQVEQGRTRAHGGLGIGLTLVKSMVQMHGGHVEARSDGPGQGSEFIIRLPRGTAPEAEADLPASQLTGNVRPRNILLVDDNVDAADTLASLLRARQHDVVTAFNGAAALDRAEEIQPDVVILDLGMPEMDGCEVAEKLRARHEGDELILVALTGWGGVEDRQRTAAAGFDYHFVKPAKLEEIEFAISQGRRNQPAEATS
jgi:CheY-like chemotaxis protein